MNDAMPQEGDNVTTIKTPLTIEQVMEKNTAVSIAAEVLATQLATDLIDSVAPLPPGDEQMRALTQKIVGLYMQLASLRSEVIQHQRIIAQMQVEAVEKGNRAERRKRAPAKAPAGPVRTRKR